MLSESLPTGNADAANSNSECNSSRNTFPLIRAIAPNASKALISPNAARLSPYGSLSPVGWSPMP